MTALVFDAGGLIALDRDDRSVWALLRVAVDDGDDVVAPTGAIAQAWRNGARQARLVRALQHCDEVPLDGPLARASGTLCAQSKTADIVDASVALIAAARRRRSEVTVVTSDRRDLRQLLDALGADVDILRV